MLKLAIYIFHPLEMIDSKPLGYACVSIFTMLWTSRTYPAFVSNSIDSDKNISFLPYLIGKVHDILRGFEIRILSGF